ncbi:MAG TPA: response regulator [Thermodesulfovibrionales bacterium]|jgi:DNA-binding NtrC family response regulator|nr:response regulator [Thermodesulfovibrionales bacterium]
MPQTKLLLVDDEVEFASALAERLQLRGYDVKTANNALEALALIHTHLPDVIILDLKIPGMDGIETLKTIKKIDSTIEVIMLTGHGDVQSVAEGMKSGVFEYIMKPVDIGELTVKIDNAMKKRTKEQ